MTELENINPNIFKKSEDRPITASDIDDCIIDPFDEREVFGEYSSLSSVHTN